MPRFFDLLLSIVGLLLLWPLMLVLFGLCYCDTGSPLFRQSRVGRDRRNFTLVKFRTMRVGTASVASHLAEASAITRVGYYLRRVKLDELPQLWNVVRGEMSLVGPRPCLPNQHDLIRERSIRGVFNVRPGITGLAQVTGIDMSTPRLLAEKDREMIDTLNIFSYFKYIGMTLIGRGSGDRVGPGGERMNG